MVGFTNFDPADYVFGEDPPPSTAWYNWMHGSEPRIDADFAAHVYWAAFWPSLIYFLEGEGGECSEQYQHFFAQNRYDLARDIFRRDLSKYIEEILNSTSDSCLDNPYRIEGAFANGVLSEDQTKSFAAYSIYCFDKGISALLAGSTLEAAKGFSFAQTAMWEAAHAKQHLTSLSAVSHAHEDFARMMAREGALARLEKDPRQKEKLFVFECWKGWKDDPFRYRSKADFARDMLDKCVHLRSQKKIEDWCREWENAGTQQAE